MSLRDIALALTTINRPTKTMKLFADSPQVGKIYVVAIQKPPTRHGTSPIWPRFNISELPNMRPALRHWRSQFPRPITPENYSPTLRRLEMRQKQSSIPTTTIFSTGHWAKWSWTMSGLSRLAIWAGRTFVAISVPQIPTRADYHSTKFWVPEQKNFVYITLKRGLRCCSGS